MNQRVLVSVYLLELFSASSVVSSAIVSWLDSLMSTMLLKAEGGLIVTSSQLNSRSNCSKGSKSLARSKWAAKLAELSGLERSKLVKLERGVVRLLNPTVGVARGVTWRDWMVERVETEEPSDSSKLRVSWFDWCFEVRDRGSVERGPSVEVLWKLSSSTDSPSRRLT